MRFFINNQIKFNVSRSKNIPDARTMPDITTLNIGAAKRMLAAIMFFDFENFTAVTSKIPPEQTLIILNVATTTVMKIIREWGGCVEKHTGDGVMGIIGTETQKLEEIAREAIEVAQTINYIMRMDVMPGLMSQGLPLLNFRIGLEMGDVLISRIGIHGMSFLTAVGSPANRASKLEGLAKPNGIAIGENLTQNLHPYLHDFIEQGDDPSWNWLHSDGTPYKYYHYNFKWPEPKQWLSDWLQLKRSFR